MDYIGSSFFIIIGMMFSILSFAIDVSSVFYAIISFISMLLGFVFVFLSFSVKSRYIKDASKKRISEEDFKKLIALKQTGPKTRSIVNKIFSEQENGFLKYDAVFKNIKELSASYNEELSHKLKGVFEKEMMQ